MGYMHLDWIQIGKNSDQWLVLVNTVMNFGLRKRRRNFLASYVNASFS